MALLLERLGPGFPPDAQKHAAEILAAVARSQVLPGAMPVLILARALVLILARALVLTPHLSLYTGLLSDLIVIIALVSLTIM